MQQNQQELKKQTTIDIDGTTYTVNHYYNGKKTLTEMIEDFLKRKLQNL